MRPTTLLIVLLPLATGLATPSRGVAGCFLLGEDVFVPNSPSGTTVESITMAFLHNVVADIKASTAINPFGGPSANVKVTFDGTNTDVVFSGTPVSVGASGVDLLVGMSVSHSDLLDDLYYTTSDGATTEVPAATVADNPTGGNEYLVVEGEDSEDTSSQLGGSSTNSFNTIISESSSLRDKYTVTEVEVVQDAAKNGYFSNWGYMFLPRQETTAEILGVPEAGSPGSPFTPLPGLDGPIAAGGTKQATITPEPASLALWGLGAAALFIQRSWRRKARHADAD